MDINLMRKYLHDLSNALNAAKINAYLLRRIHGDSLDRETISGLDGALRDAEGLVAEFHEKVHAESLLDNDDSASLSRAHLKSGNAAPK